MRLTGPQIAAAIALSGLTQDGLAKEAGIGRNTLNKIINGTATYREDTIKKVCNILEARGVEFTPAEGVRKKDRMVDVLESEDAYQRLWDDVYETLKTKGGEVLVANVDESKTINIVSKEQLDNHLKRLGQAKITERLLVCEGQTTLVAPLEYYHAVPQQYFSSYPFFVYGPKLALVSRQPELKVIIINDDRFADSVRRLFNIVWDQTAVPTL